MGTIDPLDERTQPHPNPRHRRDDVPVDGVPLDGVPFDGAPGAGGLAIPRREKKSGSVPVQAPRHLDPAPADLSDSGDDPDVELAG
jgi:hypothetical protein